MEMLDDDYTLDDILDLSFKVTPRGVFSSRTSQLALDYHCGLLPLKRGDRVHIKLYLKMPEIDKSVYLMGGRVYRIDREGFECSFGGLLLLYKGDINENLVEDAKVYLSVAKV